MKKHKIALVDTHQISFEYDDVMLADRITDWFEVTDKELDALKKYSGYLVVEHLDPIDTARAVAAAMATAKANEAKEVARKKVEAKKEAEKAQKALARKRTKLEKLKAELENAPLPILSDIVDQANKIVEKRNNLPTTPEVRKMFDK